MTEKSIFSSAHRQAISDGRKGTTQTAETRQKIGLKVKEAWARRKALKQKTNVGAT